MCPTSYNTCAAVRVRSPHTSGLPRRSPEALRSWYQFYRYAILLPMRSHPSDPSVDKRIEFWIIQDIYNLIPNIIHLKILVPSLSFKASFGSFQKIISELNSGWLKTYILILNIINSKIFKFYLSPPFCIGPRTKIIS